MGSSKVRGRNRTQASCPVARLRPCGHAGALLPPRGTGALRQGWREIRASEEGAKLRGGFSRPVGCWGKGEGWLTHAGQDQSLFLTCWNNNLRQSRVVSSDSYSLISGRWHTGRTPDRNFWEAPLSSSGCVSRFS